MPQMAPTWWLTMFMFFIITYLMIMMTVYHYHVYMMKYNKNMPKNINNLDWKW